MSPNVLVAGIGNIFLGDDAFGSEVARRLMARSWRDNVRVVDFGIRGFDLTFALLDGYDVVILLDAVPPGGEPGTLYIIEPDLSEIDTAGRDPAAIETHGMNPMRVLGVAKSMGAQWKRILLVGCEPSPGSADPDGPGVMGLSEPVRGAVDRAVTLVDELVARILAGDSEKIANAT
jgi:hydrogenase maturation protease